MPLLLLLTLTGCPSTDDPSTASGPGLVIVHACFKHYPGCEAGQYTEVGVNPAHVVAVSPIIQEYELEIAGKIEVSRSNANSYLIIDAPQGKYASGVCFTPGHVPLQATESIGLCLEESVAEVVKLLNP